MLVLIVCVPSGKTKYSMNKLLYCVFKKKYYILLISRALKNAGGVKFYGMPKTLTDYNALPSTDNFVGPKIQIFDGTNSSIMAIGFDHLVGCDKIERMILHRCTHMENEALAKISIIKDTLVELQVTECLNVDDSGLLALKDLHNLRKLTIYGFRYVKDLNGVVRELKKSLPKCSIVSIKSGTVV